MEDIVKAGMPHTQATLTFDEGYPPLAPSAGNTEMLALLRPRQPRPRIRRRDRRQP